MGGGADAPTRDSAALPEVAADTMPAAGETTIETPDAPVSGEAGSEAGLPHLDLAPQTGDSSLLDGPGAEVGRPYIDATSANVDTSVDGSTAPAGQADAPSDSPDVVAGNADDAPLDSVDTAFQPGPATGIVVNSGNTAQYNLGDGTWKVFFFDAVAGQIYVVSELSGIVRGYLSTSLSVSPTNYQIATDLSSGALLLTAPTSQRYYLAVAVSGGGASGSFQVADGGQPIALGSTVLLAGSATGVRGTRTNTTRVEVPRYRSSVRPSHSFRYRYLSPC